MRAPTWLPRESVEFFGVLKSRLEMHGLNSSSFTEALALASMRLAEIETLNRLIEEDGPIYLSVKYTKDDDGKMHKSILKKSNPAVSQRNEAMRHLQSLLSDFGLTPASIGKVCSAGGGGKRKNPFEAMNG
ncbi:MAG: P27 family phage terminase small subunit [Pseudodesulfovibrio sp.]|nr:P27 family phage terminase small subunit [Pseudodesulfovibrio sp.]